MSAALRMVAMILLLPILGGCIPEMAARQATVSPLSIAKKKEYIRTSKATLKNFQTTAIDLRARGQLPAIGEFAKEVKNYISLQVEPILVDAAAVDDLQTRLEVAKLQLLCGLVYADLAEYREARLRLEEMMQRYGSHPDVLNAAIDRNDIGFATLASGMQDLRARIENRAPGRRSLPALPTPSSLQST